MKKSNLRVRSLRWLGRTGDSHEGQNYAMRFPWMVSATNTTPYWESGVFGTATDLNWPSDPNIIAGTKPGFGIWFKCLSDYTITAQQPIFDIGGGAGSTISAYLSGSAEITFTYAEYTAPFFSGGVSTTTQTFTMPRALDDGEWHFVGFALKGGNYNITTSNTIMLIVDHWSKDVAGAADAIGCIGNNHWLRIGRSGGYYAEHIEYAEATLYATGSEIAGGSTSGGDLDSLKYHYQFFPLQLNNPYFHSLVYSKYIVGQWMNEPQYIDGGVWRTLGTYTNNLIWNGVTNFETLPVSSWPRGEIIGSLYDRKLNLAVHPKSWAGNIGNSMLFTAEAVSGWTDNTDVNMPYLVSGNISGGQALDIPTNQKNPINDNSVYSRQCKIMKRHPV